MDMIGSRNLTSHTDDGNNASRLVESGLGALQDS
jgi:hypothetical protein